MKCKFVTFDNFVSWQSAYCADYGSQNPRPKPSLNVSLSPSSPAS